MDLVVDDYLQGLQLQREFGSLRCVGAAGLWFDLHTEACAISRSWDVIVKRNLGKRYTRKV